MATDDDDGYKEGVDFEWVQGNDDENSGFKTRRFFTKAEKKARNAPKVEAPKAAAPKKPAPKLKGITTPKITTKKIDQFVRPEGKPAGMPAGMPKGTKKGYTGIGGYLGTVLGNYVGRQLSGPSKLDKLKQEAKDQTERSKFSQGMKELMTGRKGAAAQYKKGGMIKEGSAKDMREDKAMAKKVGMTMKQHEASAADKKHDAPKKMAIGGVVKKAGGGTMRGTGAAVRGKRFTGSY